MRLTLRTLLAYLDDILEPAQAKEMGTKIAESSVASALVDRIRETMRRRRLSAPEVRGPGMGVDPNAVAEYLDNTLSPEAVADVEKVFLESDVHLAEVAACHQVLALVLGEPVEITPESRERMYGLAPPADQPAAAASGALEQLTAEPPAIESLTPLPETRAPQTQKAPDLSAEGIPVYLQRRPFWRRALPMTVVSVCVGLWILFLLHDLTGQSPLWSLFGRNGGEEQNPTELVQNGRLAANEGARKPPNANLPSDLTASEEEQAADIPTDKEGELELPAQVAADSPPDQHGSKDSVAETATADPAGTGPKFAAEGKPAEEPAPEPAGDEMPEGAPNQVAATDVQPKLPGEPSPADETAKPPLPADPLVAADVTYISHSGIMLHYDRKNADWFTVPRLSKVDAGERFAVPKPFGAVLEVDGGKCRVTLLGGTSVRTLPPTEAGAFGLELKRGRVLFQLNRSGNQPGDRVVLGVAVKDELWQLEFLSGDTICGIEVIPRQPDAFEQQFGEETLSGGLYVASGSVRLASASGENHLVNAGHQLSLTPAERRTARDAGKPLEAEPFAKGVPWLEPSQKQTSPVHRYASRFEKELLNDKAASLTAPAVASDQHPQISEYGVDLLAVTDNYASMVVVVAEGEHEEARHAAYQGLRTWLPTAGKNAALLQAELGRAFRPEDADAVYRLLWGFNENDARDRDASTQLVEWLNHDRVAIRELAFYYLFRLTGRRSDYSPLRPRSHRNAAVKRLRSLIEREGALLH